MVHFRSEANLTQCLNKPVRLKVRQYCSVAYRVGNIDREPARKAIVVEEVDTSRRNESDEAKF
jgi:hypothetical protein